jgi:hypothetical protein
MGLFFEASMMASWTPTHVCTGHANVFHCVDLPDFFDDGSDLFLVFFDNPPIHFVVFIFFQFIQCRFHHCAIGLRSIVERVDQCRFIHCTRFQFSTFWKLAFRCALVNLGVKTNRLINLLRRLSCKLLLSSSALAEKTDMNRFTNCVAWTVANLSSRFLYPCAKVAS